MHEIWPHHLGAEVFFFNSQNLKTFFQIFQIICKSFIFHIFTAMEGFSKIMIKGGASVC